MGMLPFMRMFKRFKYGDHPLYPYLQSLLEMARGSRRYYPD